MLHEKLSNISQSLDEWCKTNNIVYDIVCDESDMQGIMVFKKDRALLRKLLEHIMPIAIKTGIHVESKKVRGGTIIALSLRALSEKDTRKVVGKYRLEEETLADRIDNVMVGLPLHPDEPLDLASSINAEAAKMEAQFKPPTSSLSRASSVSRGRPFSNERNEQASGTPEDAERQSTKGPVKGAKKGNKKRYTDEVAEALQVRPSKTYDVFSHSLDSVLSELAGAPTAPAAPAAAPAQANPQQGMSGMATPSGAQPGDVFQKFAKAMQVLGQQLHIGPIQDHLKKRGINWTKSDDGQSVILYVINAATKAKQPIGRISAQTLEKPQEFERQLKEILDFAKGEAPGATQQKQDQIQDMQKAISDIARSLAPEQGEQKSEVEQQMDSGPLTPAAQAAAASKQLPG